MAILEILLGPMFIWIIAEVQLIYLEVYEGVYCRGGRQRQIRRQRWRQR